jgi:hypothetical protein
MQLVWRGWLVTGDASFYCHNFVLNYACMFHAWVGHAQYTAWGMWQHPVAASALGCYCRESRVRAGSNVAGSGDGAGY